MLQKSNPCWSKREGHILYHLRQAAVWPGTGTNNRAVPVMVITALTASGTAMKCSWAVKL